MQQQLIKPRDIKTNLNITITPEYGKPVVRDIDTQIGGASRVKQIADNLTSKLQMMMTISTNMESAR